MAQEVNVHVIGMTHMKGKSKKSGSDYEFANIEYLRTVTPHFKNDNTEIKKGGFEVVSIEVPCDLQSWNEFQKMPFNSRVTLILEPNPKDISKSICVGFIPAQNQKAS